MEHTFKAILGAVGYQLPVSWDFYGMKLKIFIQKSRLQKIDFKFGVLLHMNRAYMYF